jgi:two-component system, cell cycle response regulator DivK
MLSPQIVEKIPLFPWFLSNAGDDDETPSFSPGSGRSTNPDSPTILVVDDDLANLALAEALLNAEGFDVCVAMDGPSMFGLLKTCRPALILMDIQLPEIDGWELTRKLKADPATKDIPVIAITAYGKSGDEKKARETGFVDFLAKPVSTRELPEIVRRHLAAS